MVSRPEGGQFPAQETTLIPEVVIGEVHPRQHHRHVLPPRRRVDGGRVRAARLNVDAHRDPSTAKVASAAQYSGLAVTSPARHRLICRRCQEFTARPASSTWCAVSTAMTASAIGSANSASRDRRIAGTPRWSAATTTSLSPGSRRPGSARPPARWLHRTGSRHPMRMPAAPHGAGWAAGSSSSRQRSTAAGRPSALPRGRRGRRRRPRRWHARRTTACSAAG